MGELFQSVKKETIIHKMAPYSSSTALDGTIPGFTVVDLCVQTFCCERFLGGKYLFDPHSKNKNKPYI